MYSRNGRQQVQTIVKVCPRQNLSNMILLSPLPRNPHVNLLNLSTRQATSRGPASSIKKHCKHPIPPDPLYTADAHAIDVPTSLQPMPPHHALYGRGGGKSWTAYMKLSQIPGCATTTPLCAGHNIMRWDDAIARRTFRKSTTSSVPPPLPDLRTFKVTCAPTTTAKGW